MSTTYKGAGKILEYTNTSTAIDSGDVIALNGCFGVALADIAANNWEHAYDREQAAYPVDSLRRYKYWPPVNRVDNVYGDRNLFCACPAIESYREDAEVAGQDK